MALLFRPFALKTRKEVQTIEHGLSFYPKIPRVSDFYFSCQILILSSTVYTLQKWEVCTQLNALDECLKNFLLQNMANFEAFL